MKSRWSAEEVTQALEDAGADVHERYSGRFMYGAECPGVEGDWPEIMEALVELASVDFHMAKYLASNARTDSMGQGVIVYWPSITWPKQEEAA